MPFILASILYVYSDDIMQDADSVFPTIQQYSNKELDEKAKVYLKIQRDRDVYATIVSQMQKREKNRNWIVENLLYEKKSEKSIPIVKKEVVRKKKIAKEQHWKLQILYPNKKVAIINSKIVHEGFMVDGAKVIKIMQNKVLLKTKKGKKWLSLFH